MANVFRSKEVYKHLNYNLHDRNEIVPVQGVYISGEYRPPYYNDPVLMIYEMSSQPPKVDDFQDVNRSSDEDSVVKILDFSVNFLQPSFTYYNRKQTNMTPEPTLRLSYLSSEKATIENYT